MGDMVQMDDHITNRTPDLPDDVILKKHGEDVYSCIMLRKKFTGNSLISSTMSFDHRMAPLIVIAGEIGKSAKGEAEHREHYEVVLFDEGINIWHHTYRDGKPGWYKAAFLKAKFLPKKRYDLQVKLSYTKRGKVMTVTCDGKTFGYTDNNLPDSYYAGLIGCDADNRRAEAGYWLGEPYWGRGYATEALGALLAFAFTTLELNRVGARHFGSNPASGRVMEKCGMRREGVLREYILKNGAFEDAVCCGILKSEWLLAQRAAQR